MPRQLTPEALAHIQRYAVALPVGDAYETAETVMGGPALYQLAVEAHVQRRPPAAPQEPDITEQWFASVSQVIEPEPIAVPAGLWARIRAWLGW